MSSRPSVLLLTAIQLLTEDQGEDVPVKNVVDSMEKMWDDDVLVPYEFEVSPVSGDLVSSSLKDDLISLIHPLEMVEVKGDNPHVRLLEDGRHLLETVTLTPYEEQVLRRYCKSQ